MRTKHYLAFSASALTLLALVLLPALLGAAATSPSGTPPSLQISPDISSVLATSDRTATTGGHSGRFFPVGAMGA